VLVVEIYVKFKNLGADVVVIYIALLRKSRISSPFLVIMSIYFVPLLGFIIPSIVRINGFK